MNKKLKAGIGIGGPSIIMVFVVLSLTTLGTLSLVTANSDWRLTQKTADAISKYYAADSEIEEILASVDASIHLGKPLGKTVFEVKVDDKQNMILSIEDLGNSYLVKSRKLINTTYWNYEEHQITYNDTIVE